MLCCSFFLVFVVVLLLPGVKQFAAALALLFIHFRDFVVVWICSLKTFFTSYLLSVLNDPSVIASSYECFYQFVPLFAKE